LTILQKLLSLDIEQQLRETLGSGAKKWH